MFAQFYSGMRWSALPVFALLLFLGTFLTVVVRTLLPSKRSELDRHSRLPFEGDRPPGATGAETSR
jgi:cbb3-type cytochrome oxidase subunit 3